MVTEPSTSSERMIERELMVTGEAVAVEIIPATVVNRIASGLIDYTVYSLGGACPRSWRWFSSSVATSRRHWPRTPLSSARSSLWSPSPGESSSPCSSSSSAGAGAWGAW